MQETFSYFLNIDNVIDFPGFFDFDGTFIMNLSTWSRIKCTFLQYENIFISFLFMGDIFQYSLYFALEMILALKGLSKSKASKSDIFMVLEPSQASANCFFRSSKPEFCSFF